MSVQIEYVKDITADWQHWDRNLAVVLIGDQFYFDYNHQLAMETYAHDYWKKLDYDLDAPSDYEEACAYTDDLFRKGKINGFDVFTDYTNDGTHQYLISHYRCAFTDPHRAHLINDYAKSHGYQLGTFTSSEELGDDCWLIELQID